MIFQVCTKLDDLKVLSNAKIFIAEGRRLIIDIIYFQPSFSAVPTFAATTIAEAYSKSYARTTSIHCPALP